MRVAVRKEGISAADAHSAADWPQPNKSARQRIVRQVLVRVRHFRSAAPQSKISNADKQADARKTRRWQPSRGLTCRLTSATRPSTKCAARDLRAAPLHPRVLRVSADICVKFLLQPRQHRIVRLGPRPRATTAASVMALRLERNGSLRRPGKSVPSRMLPKILRTLR